VYLLASGPVHGTSQGKQRRDSRELRVNGALHGSRMHVDV
jgi:hypothetical protein